MAVTYASIYLTILELEIFETCRQSLDFRMPLLYFRYIDDLFYISTYSHDIHLFFTTFDGFHPSIRLTSNISSSGGIFLDIEPYKGPAFYATGILDTRLHQKPINSYLYIPPTSFHQPTVFTSLIVAEIRRYRLLCSQDHEFYSVLSLFYDRLLARGYQPDFLNPLFSNFPDRRLLLTSQTAKTSAISQRSATSNTPPLVFSVPFSYRTSTLHLSRLLNVPQYLRASPIFDMILTNQSRPIICFRRASNLRDHLVSSAYSYNVIVPPADT
jgi:hypothetical protein